MDCALTVQVQHTGQRSAGHEDAETAKEHVHLTRQIDNQPISGFKSSEEYERTYESR